MRAISPKLSCPEGALAQQSPAPGRLEECSNLQGPNLGQTEGLVPDLGSPRGYEGFRIWLLDLESARGWESLGSQKSF
jgi:hypothetical protein